jgi:hypothetical protein
VILVRRVTQAAAAGDTAPSPLPRGAGPSPSANGATAPGVEAPRGAAPSGAAAGGAGLDAELGSAFDHAFGDTPPSTAAPGADLGSTQAMGTEDAAKVFSQASPPATEWYVAIGQAQVGPLPLGEVKKKWEAGDVGPDSLVWRPGMNDWAPLTTVSELAGFLAPVPRAAPQSRGAARPAAEAKPEPQPEPAAEVAWKPAGASALAALASEEIASRAPDARPAPVRSAGVRSLVDALPDGGGVDPTGALPLNIKALESSTGERKIERRSSVARGAEKMRHRRSATRAVVIGAVVAVVLVVGGLAAALGLGWIDRSRVPAGTSSPATAAVPLPPPPVVPQAATPQAAPQAAPPPPPQATAAATPTSAPATPKATPRPARAEPPPPREPARREAPRVAAAVPPPTPPPAKTTKKGDSILDFDSTGDSALDDALGGGSAPSSRSVYVPPARAGGGALPDRVSTGDINGAVAQRVDALRKCVSEQKTREPDATGTIKMRWLIQGDGSVRDVKCITPEYAQGQFAACIGGVVRGIRFPRSTTTGQEVTFPFNF